MSTVPHFPMTPATARRLFQVFTDADLVHHLKGTRHADYLRKAARQYQGQTRRYLLRVAALEDDVPLFMNYFLEDEPGSMEKFIESIE